MRDEQKFFKALGQRIRTLRKEHGYSQEDMIDFGFSARHWQQIESGRPITVNTLLRICKVFHCPMEQLVRGLDSGMNIDAALRGRQFVSATSKGSEFTNTPGKRVPRRHEVLFYSDDAILLDRLTRFIAAALKDGSAAIVLATKSHRDSLLRRLKTKNVDIEGALQRGTLISLDASETLSRIMVDGLPDPARFFGGLGSLVEAAAEAAKAARPRVAVFGEAVALLRAEGKSAAAIRFEQLGNDLTKTHYVNILCAYPLSSFPDEEEQHVLCRICAEHSAVSCDTMQKRR